MNRACQSADVFDAVEFVTGIERYRVLSPSRHHEVTRARALLCWGCRLCCPLLSLPEIAQATSRTNHTSVIGCIDRAKRLFETDDGFRADMLAVLALLSRSVEVPEAVRGMVAVNRTAPETPQGHWDAPVAPESIARV